MAQSPYESTVFFYLITVLVRSTSITSTHSYLSCLVVLVSPPLVFDYSISALFSHSQWPYGHSQYSPYTHIFFLPHAVLLCSLVAFAWSLIVLFCSFVCPLAVPTYLLVVSVCPLLVLLVSSFVNPLAVLLGLFITDHIIFNSY